MPGLCGGRLVPGDHVLANGLNGVVLPYSDEGRDEGRDGGHDEGPEGRAEEEATWTRSASGREPELFACESATTHCTRQGRLSAGAFASRRHGGLAGRLHSLADHIHQKNVTR